MTYFTAYHSKSQKKYPLSRRRFMEYSIEEDFIKIFSKERDGKNSMILFYQECYFNYYKRLVYKK